MAHSSFGDVQVFDRKKWSDGLQLFEWKKNEWMPVRFFGPIYSDYRHNVKTKSQKMYFEYCLGYDVENDGHFADREEKCPACAAHVPGQQRFYCNCIDMRAWEMRPATMPPDWTPIRMMELSQTLVKQLKSLVQLNKGESITDPKMGAIVNVKFNPDGDAATMYAANIEHKNWAIPDEIAALSVTQVLPDGRRVERKAGAGIPGAYTYNRKVNTRAEIEKGLSRHGYYDNLAGGPDAPVTTTKATQAAAEEYGELPQAKIDNTMKTATQTPVSAGAEFDPRSLVSDKCSAEFGQFADDVVCYTKCGARNACKELTLKSQTSQKSKPSKGKDDDDTV